MPDMKKKYDEEVRKALAEKLGIKNVMQIPKLQKTKEAAFCTVF